MRLKQEFQELGEFVEAYRGRISREGMLVRASSPQPAGTRLDVEIRLAEALPLVVGKAEIAGPSSRFSGGMVLRFLELDQRSRELIERLEGEFDRDGVPQFRVDAEVASPSPATSQNAPLHARPPASVSKVSPGEVPGRARPAAAAGEDDVYSVVAAALGDDTGSSRSAPAEPEDADESDGSGGGSPLRRVVAVVVVLVVIGVALTAAVMLMRGGSLLPGGNGQDAEPVATAAPVADPEPRPTVAVIEPAETVAVPTPEPATTPARPVEPAASPRPQPPSASGAGGQVRATGVRGIAVEDRGDSTVVTLTVDGAFGEARLRSSKLDDPPRLVLRLLGMTEEYTPYTTAVDGPRLTALRAWHYGDLQPPELRVVLDLATSGVTVDGVRVDADRVVVTLGGG